MYAVWQAVAVRYSALYVLPAGPLAGARWQCHSNVPRYFAARQATPAWSTSPSTRTPRRRPRCDRCMASGSRSSLRTATCPISPPISTAWWAPAARSRRSYGSGVGWCAPQ